MDIISFNEASTANSRIENINANPDSVSGIVTQPSVIASGESVSIPAGRQTVVGELDVQGTLDVQGDLFVVSGGSLSQTTMKTEVIENSVNASNPVEFSVAPIVPTPTTGTQVANKAYVDTKAPLESPAFTGAPTVPTPTTDYQVANKKYVDDIAESVVVVGSIIIQTVNVVPSGYLECNGAELSRTTYAALFAVIGTTYGAGNGSTTFKLPDLRGEFIRGFDNGRGVDSGRSIGSFQADELKSHNHSVTALKTASTSGSGLNGGGSSTYNFSTNYTGGTETRPRNIAMMYCIKY